MDYEVRISNAQASADAAQKNALALIGRLDAALGRIEYLEKGAEQRDREMTNLRMQNNLLNEQVAALQLAVAESRTYSANYDRLE